jgi:hypothetical protein
MQAARNISMTKHDFEDIQIPTKPAAKLFKLIVELANLGVRLKISEDFGGNTLTVSYTVDPHSVAAAVVKNDTPEEAVQNHFHTGFPDCSETEGELSLMMYLQNLVIRITRENMA